MQNVKGRPDTHDCNEKDYNGHFFFILNIFFGKDKVVGTKSLNENECQTCWILRKY